VSRGCPTGSPPDLPGRREKGRFQNLIIGSGVGRSPPRSDDSSCITGTEFFVADGAAHVSDLSREINIDLTRLREELDDEHE
jgi:hypothetical protein